jgi:hypothetical protein
MSKDRNTELGNGGGPSIEAWTKAWGQRRQWRSGQGGRLEVGQPDDTTSGHAFRVVLTEPHVVGFVP